MTFIVLCLMSILALESPNLYLYNSSYGHFSKNGRMPNPSHFPGSVQNQGKFAGLTLSSNLIKLGS